jgi:hypothetical protein
MYFGHGMSTSAQHPPAESMDNGTRGVGNGMRFARDKAREFVVRKDQSVL